MGFTWKRYMSLPRFQCLNQSTIEEQSSAAKGIQTVRVRVRVRVMVRGFPMP